MRSRRKSSATNRLSLTATEVRAHDTRRHAVEEGIRVLKSHLSLDAWQVGDRRPNVDARRPPPEAQEHHSALCLVAYLVVERERLNRRLTWRQRKRQLILRSAPLALHALERVREAA